MTLGEKIQMLRVDAGGLHDPWLRECGTFDASASFSQASVKKSLPLSRQADFMRSGRTVPLRGSGRRRCR